MAQPVSKPLSFPPYRRSHLRSQTYLTLVRIFSHLPATLDNGSGRMGQEKLEKGPQSSEFAGSAPVDPKDPVLEKMRQEVRETTDGVGDDGRESGTNDVVLHDIEKMLGIEEVEDPLRRKLENMSKQTTDFNEQQRIMDDLEMAMEGTEDFICDSGLISNPGLGEKQDGNNEVELMDYQEEHVEFQHPNVDKFGNASDLQVLGELTTTKECELEKEEQDYPKVAAALPVSLDTTIEALNVSEDGRLLNSATLGDKLAMQHEEKVQKSICANDASHTSNILIKKGDMEEGELASNSDIEEGELAGDFGMDGNSFYMSSPYSLILNQNKIDEVQKPKNIVKDIVLPCKIGNGEKEDYESISFIVNTHQDGYNSWQLGPGTSDKIRFASGDEVEISQETVKCCNAGVCGSVPKPRNSEDRQIGSKGFPHVRENYARNQVLYTGLWEEDANQDHENFSTSKVDVIGKKKRSRGSEERKAKRKQKKRKIRAKKNKQLGVKRLKLPPVQKSKAISYCRHYLVGRCREGDKCQFSHDTMPLTKSTPCCHFARQSCMKGDDCPFDHELSKYPCNNFVTKGFCSRGDACLFAHQLPAKEDGPMLSKVCRPESKSPLLSGNTSFSAPPSSCGSSVQQNNLISSTGICSPINSEDKVTDTVQMQFMPAPKGISFVNVGKSSLPSPSPPKQGRITPPKKESLIQIGAYAEQHASGTNQTFVEIPQKLSAVAPKGVNFISFGNGSVSSSRSTMSSLFNKESGIQGPQFVNCGLANHASSSLKKDDRSKSIDGANQSVPKIDVVSNEIFEKNPSGTEGMKLSFPGKALTDDATTDLQGSSCSDVNHTRSKSVQEAKPSYDYSRTSTSTASMVLVPQFDLHRSSECLPSRNHEHESYSGQRALWSTLGFAAELESSIKMKYSTRASGLMNREEHGKQQ